MGLVVGICQAPCVLFPTYGGNTFEANPYTRPYYSIFYPGGFEAVSHAGETLYGC